MNCKQGDLAIIIRGNKNSGKVVQCMRVYENRIYKDPQTGIVYRIEPRCFPIWEIDRPILWKRKPDLVYHEAYLCSDRDLVPIPRGNPDQKTEVDTYERIPE